MGSGSVGGHGQQGGLHEVLRVRENAELSTHQAKSAVLAIKFADLLKTHADSQRNINEFQRQVLANSHEIGESLKFRYRTWDEFAALLKQARRFKEWLSQQDPSDALIHEYLRALEKDTWAGSLPGKVARFILLEVVGSIAPGIVTTLLSAADSFLLERLLGGWKPSQFVHGPLKRDFARQD